MVSFTQPFTLVAGTSATGPAASSGFLTADFTATPTTGAQTIANTIWGTSISDVSFNNWSVLSDLTYISQNKQIPLPLYRFNALSSVVGGPGSPFFLEASFNSNGSLITFQYIDRFIDAWPLAFSNYLSLNPLMIMGMGQNPTTWSSPAAYGNAWTQACTRFNTRNSAALGQPLPIFGFEVGNETQDSVSQSTYNAYFNAAADAAHAVNPNYKIFGPTYNFFGAPAGNNGYPSFFSSCGSRCGGVSYHGYKFGGNQNPGAAAIMNMSSSPNAFRAHDEALNAASAISAAGLSLPIFMGEWTQDDTFTFNGDETQQSIVGGVFVAQWMLDAIRANPNPPVLYGAMWEQFQNAEYGMIQGQNGPAGGINAAGFVMSKASQTMFGTRVSDNGVTNNGSKPINMLSVRDDPNGTSNRFAVMMINWSTGTAVGPGQVALSHWPLNTSGNGTIQKWLINAANPTGVSTPLSVTAGLTDAITLPATSVTILSP